MQMQLIKEGIHNYMVLPWEQEWKDGYESRLFQYHKVPNFLQYEMRSLNGQMWLYYLLQYHTSLQSVMGHLPFTYDRVYRMIESVLDAFDMIEEYFIETDGIVWDSRAIYMDVETGRLQFTYYPDGTSKGELRNLITEWLQYIDKKQDDVVLLVMGFYDLVTEQNWSPDALESFRNEMKRHGAAGEKDASLQIEGVWKEEGEQHREAEMDTAVRKSQRQIESFETQTTRKRRGKKRSRVLTGVTGVVALVDVIMLAGVATGMLSFMYVRYLLIGILLLIGLTIGLMPDKEKESIDDIMQEYLCDNKVQADVLREADQIKDRQLSNHKEQKNGNTIIGETSLLMESDGKAEDKQMLVKEQTKENIHLEALEKDRYPVISLQGGSVVIGSMAEGCTYVLKERGISRLHAKIMEKADGIYLLDLNSTNGTYLNGEVIEAGKDYKIEEGDLVAFAKCEYYVV